MLVTVQWRGAAVETNTDIDCQTGALHHPPSCVTQSPHSLQPPPARSQGPARCQQVSGGEAGRAGTVSKLYLTD